jgi:cephalosporin-C deacetylase-like acetyl esterase
VVYKARDLRLDRLVALKFLPRDLSAIEADSDRVRRERFIQEAKAASALDHPNIGVVHEIDETEEGETFIAMAYYEGSPTFGFRCVKYTSDAPLAPAVTGELLDAFRDYAREKPVSEDVFRIYKGLYSYDKTPLQAVVESVDESVEDWRKEKISFDASYGQEKVTAYLFLPQQGKPPYQTVIYFPGSNAIQMRSSEEQALWVFDFLVRNGRAVMFPIYKGTFERGDDLKSDYPSPTSFYREHVLQWHQDLARSIDYLETREEIDRDKLAYYGLSWGGSLVMLPAVEERLKVAVFLGGGFYFSKALPEVDQINFAPRVRVPALMINGRMDFFYPYETSQAPMFRLLGAPEKDKRHVVLDSGHIPPKNEFIKETLDWLDRYLGPVSPDPK